MDLTCIPEDSLLFLRSANYRCEPHVQNTFTATPELVFDEQEPSQVYSQNYHSVELIL